MGEALDERSNCNDARSARHNQEYLHRRNSQVRPISFPGSYNGAHSALDGRGCVWRICAGDLHHYGCVVNHRFRRQRRAFWALRPGIADDQARRQRPQTVLQYRWHAPAIGGYRCGDSISNSQRHLRGPLLANHLHHHRTGSIDARSGDGALLAAIWAQQARASKRTTAHSAVRSAWLRS